MRKLQNVLGTLFTRRLVLTFDKIDFVYPRLSGRRISSTAYGRAGTKGASGSSHVAST